MHSNIWQNPVVGSLADDKFDGVDILWQLLIVMFGHFLTRMQDVAS
jgi:hypothetical protein